MRWFFVVSKVKESSFLKSDLTDPPKIFDARLLENTNLNPSGFYFSVGFYIKICFESDGFIAYANEWDWREKKTIFIHTNQPLITSFYIKKIPIFCRISYESALIRNFLRNGRVRGEIDRESEG